MKCSKLLFIVIIITFIITTTNSKIKSKMLAEIFSELKLDIDIANPIEQIIIKKKYEIYYNKFSYPLQVHYVTTQDGYILKLFRISPKLKNLKISNNKMKAVLLQHGLFVILIFIYRIQATVM